MTGPVYHGAQTHHPYGPDPVVTGIWLEVEVAGTGNVWDSGTTWAPSQRVIYEGDGDNLVYLALATSTGVEPTVTAGWETSWRVDASGFLNGYDNVDDPDIDTFAYKLLIGPPSNHQNGETIDDSCTSLEFKGAAVGAALGTAICRLIPGYRPPKKRHRAGSDEYGGHIDLTVDPDGYVYRGFV